MTVKEFMELVVDTEVTLKDRRTQKFISREDFKNHYDRKVVQVYPRVHRTGNSYTGHKYNANLVLMVR